MANTKSAIKAIRVSNRKAVVNSRVKETYKKIKRDINSKLAKNDAGAAKELMPKYQSEIDTAVKKGVLKRNTGARYKARVAQAIKKASAK